MADKFCEGDIVTVLDGSDLPDYTAHWVKAMEKHVGHHYMVVSTQGVQAEATWVVWT